jgi:PadR family transcriptional regulator PadR
MMAKEIQVDEGFQKSLYNGLAELILLGTVNRANGPMYGYQIAKIVEGANTTVPVIKLGTLYPILRSLEADGLLESKVDPSVTGPPRRYYRITDLGKRTLARLVGTWEQTKGFVDNILVGAEND